MTEKSDPTRLVGLMSNHRQEIATGWMQAVRQLAYGGYAGMTQEELTTTATRGLDAIIEALDSSSFTALENYLKDVILPQVYAGFDIREVSEGLMLWQESVLPFIWQGFPPGSPAAYDAIVRLNTCLRFMLSRFGHLNTQDMLGQIRKQKQYIASILEAVQRVNDPLEIQALMEHVLGCLNAAIGVPYSSTYLLPWEQNELILCAAMGSLAETHRKTLHSHHLNPALDPFVRQVLEHGRPVACHDIQSDPQVSSETTRILGLRSMLAVPLQRYGRAIGLIMLGTFENQHSWTTEEIGIVEGVMSPVALAIENARLDMQSWSDREKLEKQIVIMGKLLETTHTEELLEFVCTEAQHLADARGSTVFLLENQSLRLAFSAGDAKPPFEYIPIEGTLLGNVARNIEPILENDSSKIHIYGEGIEPTALLAVPLHVKEHIIGVLVVVNRPGGFELYNVDDASRFADQVAIAIENAQLRERVEKMDERT